MDASSFRQLHAWHIAPQTYALPDGTDYGPDMLHVMSPLAAPQGIAERKTLPECAVVSVLDDAAEPLPTCPLYAACQQSVRRLGPFAAPQCELACREDATPRKYTVDLDARRANAQAVYQALGELQPCTARGLSAITDLGVTVVRGHLQRLCEAGHATIIAHTYNTTHNKKVAIYALAEDAARLRAERAPEPERPRHYTKSAYRPRGSMAERKAHAAATLTNMLAALRERGPLTAVELSQQLDMTPEYLRARLLVLEQSGLAYKDGCKVIVTRGRRSFAQLWHAQEVTP